MGFPDGTMVKNPTANAGDVGSIPGLGRSPGEGNGNPLQYSSLVAQTVKCLPTMQKAGVQSLGREDPLEKEMATHSSSLAWKIPWTEERGRVQSMGSQRVGHDWVTSLYIYMFTHVLYLFLLYTGRCVCGFPGVSVVKNLPASARDIGLILYMLWSN